MERLQAMAITIFAIWVLVETLFSLAVLGLFGVMQLAAAGLAETVRHLKMELAEGAAAGST
jgi:hypothetical protein